jgi:hypothetical protein
MPAEFYSRKIPGTRFCLRLSQSQGQSAALKVYYEFHVDVVLLLLSVWMWSLLPMAMTMETLWN